MRLRDEVGRLPEFCEPSTVGAYRRALLRTAPSILRRSSLSPADEAMHGRPCGFTVAGTTLRLDGADFGLAREIYGRGSYFRGDVGIRRGDVVFDLGANTGVFSLLAAASGARVVAVEAQATILRLLEANCARNPGVAGEIDTVHGMIAPESGGLADWEGAGAEGGQPPPVSIEDLVESRGIGRIDFLKVDIEGHEFGLFAGPPSWLGSVSGIAMEVHTEFGDPQQIVETLGAAGFGVSLCDPGGDEVGRIEGPAGYLYASVLCAE